jgi:5'-deoxynucleotidase YfbR-like HD superfamily hydrolase
MKSVQDFYMQMLNLAHIKRYSVIPRIHDESIAEHSFFVASIVMKLYDDYEFNIGHATCMAISHDWTESYTDDITVATKRAYPSIARAVEAVEAKIAKNEFSPVAYELWKEYKDATSVESKIVKYADTLQVIQYAQGEVNMGNNAYFKSVVEDATYRAYKLEGELHEFKRCKNISKK